MLGLKAHQDRSPTLKSLFLPSCLSPLAKQTRISGPVELTVGVRKDGSVTSLDPLRGHPLLVQAATDSVWKSKFECRDCGEEPVFYKLTYIFQLGGPTTYCAETTNGIQDNQNEKPYPRVFQSANTVTLLDRPVGTCDLPGKVTYKKVRSIKRLYIWRSAPPRPIGIE
jgi:hypothetical protein